jgi:transglutaminase-like putative cysteine protease
VGDCNEHAVLLAALARAASIPTKIETGLVYLNGRFYYHAWNLVYIGSWVTVDALFGQIPADVTHIRVTTGTEREQLDLLGLIGKIRLEVLEN